MVCEGRSGRRRGDLREQVGLLLCLGSMAAAIGSFLATVLDAPFALGLGAVAFLLVASSGRTGRIARAAPAVFLFDIVVTGAALVLGVVGR